MTAIPTTSHQRAQRAFGLALTCLLLAAAGQAAAKPPTVEEVIRATDDLLRGRSSVGTMTMRVKTSRWERTLTMKIWSEGTEKTLVEILAPAKEKGTATLKVEENIWNYLPKVDRTIKVPASMMSGSWMGSHFTNDDLVRESRFIDDYECRFADMPTPPEQQYVIDCTPKPNAPVVWGKVRLEARADMLPTRVTYYDEKDRLVRTLAYTDIAEMDGRKLPRRMTLMPAGDPGELTEITYDELRFDVELPAETFSLRALKR